MKAQASQRAAVVGIGAVHSAPEHVGCVGRIPFARVPDTGLDLPADSRNCERAEILALTAMRQACADTALRQVLNAGIVLTVSKGMTGTLERSVETLKHSGPRGLASAQALDQLGPDAVARRLARAYGLTGPTAAAVAACASGLASVKTAMDWLRDGVCDLAFAGASESSSSELILQSFNRLGVLSPTGATRPFDAARDGFVVGEGCAVLALTHDPKTAPLGWIEAVVLAGDAFHLTGPDPSGATVAEAIRRALTQAHIKPEEVGWIHAHGTGTPLNDAAESRAIQAAFSKPPPVTATKGQTGHLLGASGAVALALTFQALRNQSIPPITGLREPGAEFSKVDLVRETRACRARTALVLNYGFGGHIAVAVVSVS